MNSFAQDILAAGVIALVAMNIPQVEVQEEVPAPAPVVKSPKEQAREMKEAMKARTKEMERVVKERTKEMEAVLKQRTKEMKADAREQSKALQQAANTHAKALLWASAQLQARSPTSSSASSSASSPPKKAFVADWARLPGNEQVVYIRNAKNGLTANGVHLGEGRVRGQDGVTHETLSKFAHWERNKMEAAGLISATSDRTINAWERVRFLSPEGHWKQFDTIRTLV